MIVILIFLIIGIIISGYFAIAYVQKYWPFQEILQDLDTEPEKKIIYPVPDEITGDDILTKSYSNYGIDMLVNKNVDCENSSINSVKLKNNDTDKSIFNYIYSCTKSDNIIDTITKSTKPFSKTRDIRNLDNKKSLIELNCLDVNGAISFYSLLDDGNEYKYEYKCSLLGTEGNNCGPIKITDKIKIKENEFSADSLADPGINIKCQPGEALGYLKLNNNGVNVYYSYRCCNTK